MTVWFTSDHHFGHRNIINHCHRPFSSVEEMDEMMIQLWNTCVRPQDTVYHLGDFSWWGKSAKSAPIILSRLRGRKILIAGNHDHREIRALNDWESVHNLLTLKMDKVVMELCHYPLLSWNRMHHGSWHLHGHQHGTGEQRPGLVLDVGVDVHDFKPLPFEQIKNLMENRLEISNQQNQRSVRECPVSL